MSHPNDKGLEVASSAYDGGAEILEVWETDERGRRVDSIISCVVQRGETHAQAVAGLLAEFADPFGPAWESAEEYGRQLDAVKWLAEFYDVPTEGGSK